MNTRIGFDWKLKEGIASPLNFVVLLVLLLSFPFVLRATSALSVLAPGPGAQVLTTAVVRFCLVVGGFLWSCFAIALVGVRRRGKVGATQLIGISRKGWQAVARDVGVGAGTLLAMGVIGNLSNIWLVRFGSNGGDAYHAMLAHNYIEAFAFLLLALTAGFVEEFVFRGYIQRQCQALCGNIPVASALQLLVFTQGHLYQGWIRLVPVLLIGLVVTGVALWRRSLVPGMIAHGLGDGLVAFSFFASRL